MRPVVEQKHLDFLASLRAYLDRLDPELVAAAQRENQEDPMQPREHGRRFLQRLGADGWLGLSWPPEYGGRGLGAIEHWLFNEELIHRRLPNGLLTLNAIGPVLIQMGTDAQKEYFLPRIRAGEIEVAVGYSEPDAGSDLAALRTRAVRAGEEYVVNGQKVWTTGAQVATHFWLCTRTGAPEDRHRALTVFLIPMDSPGITITPILTQGGERTNAVYLDDLRIPVEDRIGEENQGWAAITSALNYERLFYHNDARWELEQLIAWGSDDGVASAADDRGHAYRTAVAELAVDVEVSRLMALRGAEILSRGQVPAAESSANKVWWSELRQRICATGLDLMGSEGLITHASPGAPAGGHLEHGLQTSPVWRFGGGTTEIQLDIVARTTLGMPR